MSNIYTPYTYLIGWSKHNKFYYGVRFARNCHPNDLWKTYFTSSKHVKRFRKENGDPDIIEIRKTFTNSPMKAKIWEEKVLRRMNVIKSQQWLNKNINGKFLKEGPQTKEHVNKRVSLSLITRELKKKLGYSYSPSKETITKTIKTKELNGTTGKGIPKSKEHIAHMKFHENNKPIHKCPYCNKIGDLRNMKRWHFERCKHNLNRLNDLDKIVICFKCGHKNNQSPNFYRYHNNNCIL